MEFNDKMKIMQGDLNPAAESKLMRGKMEDFAGMIKREGPYEVMAPKKQMHPTVQSEFMRMADEKDY